MSDAIQVRRQRVRDAETTLKAATEERDRCATRLRALSRTDPVYATVRGQLALLRDKVKRCQRTVTTATYDLNHELDVTREGGGGGDGDGDAAATTSTSTSTSSTADGGDASAHTRSRDSELQLKRDVEQECQSDARYKGLQAKLIAANEEAFRRFGVAVSGGRWRPPRTPIPADQKDAAQALKARRSRLSTQMSEIRRRVRTKMLQRRVDAAAAADDHDGDDDDDDAPSPKRQRIHNTRPRFKFVLRSSSPSPPPLSAEAPPPPPPPSVDMSDLFADEALSPPRAPPRHAVLETPHEHFDRIAAAPCTFCGKEFAGNVSRLNRENRYSRDNVVPECMRCERARDGLSGTRYVQHCQAVVAKHNRLYQHPYSYAVVPPNGEYGYRPPPQADW